MRDRVASIAPIAAVAGVLGVCCGLPILLSLGVLGAVAGVSLQSWGLIGLGLVLAAIGWTRWARHRANLSCDLPQPPARDQAEPEQTTNSTGSGDHL